MKRKKKTRKGSPIDSVTCKNCPTLLLDPKNPPVGYAHTHRHGLCSACLANEVDALNEKLARGGIINEDVEAQNTLMVRALFFYGDKRNYGLLGGTRMRVDKGTRAREALASGLSQEALGNVRDTGLLYKALAEIKEVTERYFQSEGGWSNMDMAEIWTSAEALLMERSKAREC